MASILELRSFRNKLFYSLLSVFSIFILIVLAFQYQREKDFKKKELETSLNDITEMTHLFIEHNHTLDSSRIFYLDSLQNIIPRKNVRITVIMANGVVRYDNHVTEVNKMENHRLRPEVQLSVSEPFGENVRKSATTGEEYYYFAKFYGTYFVRTALVYDVEVTTFLRAERVFILFSLFLFGIVWLLLAYVTNRLGGTITQLKDFAISVNNGDEMAVEYQFPDDELGEISNRVVAIYKEMKLAKDNLSKEKEKLFNHLFALNEGVAFFAKDKSRLLNNNHFIQFLNIISDVPTISPEHIFDLADMKPLVEFIDANLSDLSKPLAAMPAFEINIKKNSRFFAVKCIIFQDRSFEILILETTQLEERTLLKQQMTSNIAHELRTPVASISGYLETILSNVLDDKKKDYFIERAHAQARRLAELIDDISLITKIEEAKTYFVKQPVNVYKLVHEVVSNLSNRVEERKLEVNVAIDETSVVNGNKTLLFSVFYNLLDNSIKYANQGSIVNIQQYHSDENCVYFTFSNNGESIPEEHLSRIFERFYRVDTGRSRKNGGTGLGLAIVKNAIQLHNGEISARNLKDGGVEFLFSIQK